VVEKLEIREPVDVVGEHLMGASASGWSDACARAGTTDTDLAARYDEALQRRP
jgi:hypothetical protein